MLIGDCAKRVGGNQLVNQFIENARVLLDGEVLLVDHLRGRCGLTPTTQAPIRQFDRAAIHADGQFMRARDAFDPIDPQRELALDRRACQQCGARAVGEHPAQEIFLEGQFRSALDIGGALLGLGPEVARQHEA